MPDPTLSSGNPGASRDAKERTGGQGTGAPRRTTPGDPAAPGPARASRAGAEKRPAHFEPRWRDIQWIGFATDPEPPPATPAVAADDGVREVPGSDAVLRHLGSSAAESFGATNGGIPGLAARFVRLPVPRSPMTLAGDASEAMPAPGPFGDERSVYTPPTPAPPTSDFFRPRWRRPLRHRRAARRGVPGW